MSSNPTTPLKPETKVAAGGAAGAVTVLVVWIVTTAGLDVPETVAAAIGWIITAGIAYLVPHRPGR